jgi:putative heme-binding domain-containing protein
MNAASIRQSPTEFAYDPTGISRRRRREIRGAVGFLLVCILQSGVCLPRASAQKDARVPDPDPEIERQSFQVADGFEVNLFAADPLLAKPIQMNFDAAGRLWVACSEAYPQIRPGQRQNDKVIILEDTKGTGKADKTTVFAESLLIPTGLEPGDGGVYVVDSTDLLHLSASQPGGKADRRHVILSGFGTEDTHHMVHTLRWGPDGMLYFNQSVYIHSHLETPHGVRRLGGGGIWQFRPETLELRVVARGLVNPWGHHFDRWGQSFATDGAGGEGINYIVPGASYFWAVGAERILQGLNPGSPKDCGLEVVSGRHLPDSWQGNLITNDFRGHRVCRYIVKPEGSGYSSREQPEVIKTSHGAFRPIDVKMGPDGAIYIADWYNPIIQHGEVDFRDPRRDQTHGRIWRVTAKGRPLVDRPKLVGAPVSELLEALKAPEDWTRHMARRVLKERGANEVMPVLSKWLAGIDRDNPANEPLLLDALWTYQSLDVLNVDLLQRLLKAADPRVRAAAVHVTAAWHGRIDNAFELLSPRVADEHPQVRLEAVCALREVPSSRAATVALTALNRPMDKFLDYALWQTMRELAPQWLPAFRAGKFDFGGNVGGLLFALKAINNPDVVTPLVELVDAGKVPAEHEDSVLTLIATLGSPADLRLILDRVLADKAGGASTRRATLLVALGEAMRRRGIRPAGDLDPVASLIVSVDPALRLAALQIAGLWKLNAARPGMLQAARATDSNAAIRKAAIEGLAALGGDASRDALDHLSAEGNPSIRRPAAIALVALDPQRGAGRVVELLAMPESGDATPLFEAVLQRKNGAAALTSALAGKSLPADVAKIGIRCIRTSAREAPELVDALMKCGNLTTSGPRILSSDEMRSVVADVTKNGDAARGEALFRRKDLTCMNCHAISGAGGQVGPDLSSIGGSAQVDYLVESLLQPNKAVKEGYHSTLVTTNAGKLFTGIKLRQTATELVLRGADDAEIAIPVRDIEQQSLGGSLMPDGLTDNLTRSEFADLVRFLSELGKIGPYSVSKTPLIRRWQMLEATPAAREAAGNGGLAGVVRDSRLPWTSTYSMVNGVLPVADLPEIGSSGNCLVRCQLEVTRAGEIGLRLNGAEGLMLWLDQTPVEVGPATRTIVTRGTHTLTFAIDRRAHSGGLRVELEDVPGSNARARPVVGK